MAPKKKPKGKLSKLTKKEKNLFSLIIAVIVFLFLVVLYLSSKKEKNHRQAITDNKTLIIDPQYKKLGELEKQRDIIQNERYSNRKILLKINYIESWSKKKIDLIFKVLRWVLFLMVFGGLIVTRIDAINFIGTTTYFLKIINASGVIIFLLYFASSDENDSLMKCYINSKLIAERRFMDVVLKKKKINTKPDELKQNLQNQFFEYKSINDEIITLKNELKSIK